MLFAAGALAVAQEDHSRHQHAVAGLGTVDFPTSYVDREHRKRGGGRLALSELIHVCEEAGFWKLVSRIFPENTGSRALIASLGFREVGVYERHGQLDGVWKDVVIVERLIPTITA